MWKRSVGLSRYVVGGLWGLESPWVERGGTGRDERAGRERWAGSKGRIRVLREGWRVALGEAGTDGPLSMSQLQTYLTYSRPLGTLRSDAEAPSRNSMTESYPWLVAPSSAVRPSALATLTSTPSSTASLTASRVRASRSLG